jgi:ABC-type glutathione transport system ATPase component
MSKFKLNRIADLATDQATDGHRPVLRSIDGLGMDVGMPMVQVSQLRKTYPGGVEAVKGIDFEVAAGEVFGLLGPNGAGKSTTIGMLTTTVQPTSGSARLAGYDVVTQPLLARSVSRRGLSGRRGR